MAKICDYTGYACQCDGYHGENGRCTCGHAKSQHNSDASLPMVDEIVIAPDWQVKIARILQRKREQDAEIEKFLERMRKRS